jgi:hypothetical protein
VGQRLDILDESGLPAHPAFVYGPDAGVVGLSTRPSVQLRHGGRCLTGNEAIGRGDDLGLYWIEPLP